MWLVANSLRILRGNNWQQLWVQFDYEISTGSCVLKREFPGIIRHMPHPAWSAPGYQLRNLPPLLYPLSTMKCYTLPMTNLMMRIIGVGFINAPDPLLLVWILLDARARSYRLIIYCENVPQDKKEMHLAFIWHGTTKRRRRPFIKVSIRKINVSNATK